MDDLFFSEENLEHLKKSIQELRDGKETIHDLIDEDDEQNVV